MLPQNIIQHPINTTERSQNVENNTGGIIQLPTHSTEDQMDINNTQIIATDNNKVPPKPNTVEDQDIVNNTQASIIESSQPMIIPIRDLVQSAKRTRTNTTGTGTDESESEETMRIAKNQSQSVMKKKKTEPVPIEEMLGPLEETLKQHVADYHGLTFNNLKEYIGKTKGCKNISKLTIFSAHFKPRRGKHARTIKATTTTHKRKRAIY